MICEWLARGALCSQAYDMYKDHAEFFRHVGISRINAHRLCHSLELAAAVVVDEFIIPYFYRRNAKLSRAVVDALWALSATATPSAAALDGVLPDGVIAVVQGPCIFGLELSKRTVFLGPHELLEPIRDYTSSPIFTPFQDYLIIADTDYGQVEEVAKRYGAVAHVSCITDAPPLAYILLCDVHKELGDLLTKALGAKPYQGEATLHIQNARLAVKKGGFRV
ncbi:hypothetical protein [Pyrobaculum sp.]|uniref:hypothetical protein n=1 Tax=Pyrobaculum sp. TaxID=2004705 RepID=UPI0031665D26